MSQLLRVIDFRDTDNFPYTYFVYIHIHTYIHIHNLSVSSKKVLKILNITFPNIFYNIHTHNIHTYIKEGN